MLYQTKAIVLKTTLLGESDKILSLYSPEHGPIRAVAKGARKVNSSFGIKAQVLSSCEFLIAKGRNLDIVSQAKLIDDFRNVHQDYDALTIACFFADLLEAIAIEDDCYQDHYDLIIACLDELNRIEDSEQSFLVCLQFLWELIAQLGYKPDLHTCSGTHVRKDASVSAQYFDLKNGSIMSTAAFNDLLERDPYQETVSKMDTSVYRILQALETNNLSAKELAAQNPNYITFVKSAIKLLHSHLEHSIHKTVKSWKLLEQILAEPVLS